MYTKAIIEEESVIFPFILHIHNASAICLMLVDVPNSNLKFKIIRQAPIQES